MGAKFRLRQVTTHPGFCEVYHKINLRHADTQMVNVGAFGYNCAINKRKVKMLDTTNWAKYPFTVEGVDFVSLLDPQGSFYPQVERLPNGLFTQENMRMILELIGNPAKFSREELQAELDTVNLGASQAIVALA